MATARSCQPLLELDWGRESERKRKRLFVCVGKQQLWTSKHRFVRLFPLHTKGQKGTLWKTATENALLRQISKHTGLQTQEPSQVSSPEHVCATYTDIMISHYPLASLLPWPAIPHCLDLDGEGGVALQRYQLRSPESSPRFWVGYLHLSARLLWCISM